MTAPTYTGPVCVLPGCSNPAATSTQPCVVCRRDFGGMLTQVAGPGMTDEQVRARDEAVREQIRLQADRQAEAESWVRKNAVALGEDAEGIEKANQLCWICEDRKTCRRVKQPYGGVEWECAACRDL